MPRIRSLKPELWLSPQVMNLSRDSRLLFIGLITQADDEGRGTADPRKLKAAIFPGDDDINAARIKELQGEIESQDLGVFYSVNGHGALYCLPGFTTHQSINRSSPSRYPAPPTAVAKTHVVNGAGSLTEHSVRTPEGSEGSDLRDRKDRREGSEEPLPLSPSPARGQNGANAPADRNPRTLKRESSAAWDRVLNAAQHGESSVGDPRIDEAVRIIGGYTRLSRSHEAQRKANRARFRETFEQLVQGMALQGHQA